MKILNYILEAEDFSLSDNFETVSAGMLSGIRYVQSSSENISILSENVSGIAGTYDIAVSYWDENDGVSTATVKVDGKVIASWDWDEELGSATANPDTYTRYVIRNVEIDDAATIVVEGQRDGKEPLRIDKVELLPPRDRDLHPELKAFEGAEGFGSDTAGGRGGWIVKVTNLNDSGPGSLRWALEDLDAPRIVVFEVGGLITLEDQIKVNGDVTVAGQTAPGEGITIQGGRLQVVGDNVIIRGLKIRPGDGPGQDFQGRDAICVGSEDTIVENVVIDSNSFSWSIDEVGSVWNGARNVTYSNNIFAEALYNSKHPEGAHSMGMLIGDGANHITVTKNLFSSNVYRNPTMAAASAIEIINNYVYNPGQHGFSVTMRDGYDDTSHVIGNYFEAGPSTHTQEGAVRIVGDNRGAGVYLEDNLSWDRTDSTQPEKDVATGSLRYNVKNELQFTPSDVKAMSAADVPDYVMGHVGARVGGALDSTDARILNNVITGGGDIIDSPDDVGGYDVPTVYSTLSDTDHDGIPDIYEDRLGSDRLVFDPHGDVDGDGYSNIENYINGLISGFSSDVPAPRAFSIEAETLDVVYGFMAAKSVNASSRAVLQHVEGAEACAAMPFKGVSGVYDITVRYVDENDGVSHLAVQVRGETVDEWDWDEDLGSSIVTPATFTERTIHGVELCEGDVIALVGHGDAGEPLRIDGLDFIPVDDGAGWMV